MIHRVVCSVFVLAILSVGYAQPRLTDVFVKGQGKYPAYRIPSIVTTKAGTLLALAEGRASLSDHAANDMVLKRSTDGGRTWGPLHGSGPWRYSGRPDVGRLSTGQILLTTRVGRPQPGHCLGLYLETQKMALLPTPLGGPMTAGAFAAVIDDDTSPHPDWGYSGWVELPDGSIYAAQYITADAPPGKPFIRGYRIPRSFFTRTKEGSTR